MTAKIYYDDDADLSVLKDKVIAILGYGSQGHAQAQNLRDSGCEVIVGQRPGSPNYDLAVQHGFEPLPLEEATKRADIVNILLPDEVQGDVYRKHIRDHLSPGNVLMCSHGFNIHFVRWSRLRKSIRCSLRRKDRGILCGASSPTAGVFPA